MLIYYCEFYTCYCSCSFCYTYNYVSSYSIYKLIFSSIIQNGDNSFLLYFQKPRIMQLVRIQRKHQRKRKFKKHDTKIFKWYNNFKISLYFVTMVRHYPNKWLLINEFFVILILVVSLTKFCYIFIFY